MRLRVLLLVLALAGCGSHATQAPVEASQRPLPPPLPTQPDPLLTPGDVIEGCTASTIGDRNATANEKRGLRVLYGLSETESNVVIDHLVPHALCGADTPNNLWPEEKTSSYAKDTVERHVINLVRAGRLSLAQGQQCFIVDWHTCRTTEST